MGDLPVPIDALQYETGQGPCLDAAYEQHTVSVDDLATEQRWPRFAPTEGPVPVLGGRPV